MTQSRPATTSEKVKDTVPKLFELTKELVYGDIWERDELSKRDRSLITCAALVALARTEQLKGHTGRALDNGVSRTELTELITHLAFYGGWPAALSSALVVQEVFAARDAAEDGPETEL